jgi:hypothetical protein
MQGMFKPYATRAGILGGIVGAVVLLLSLIPVVGLCLLLVAWVVFVGTGVYAVMQGKKQGATMTIQQGAIDGAASGGIAGVIAYVVKFIADIILGVVFSVGLANGAGDVTSGIAGTLVGSCFGLVFGIIGAIIVGAIGGLIYAAIQQNQSKAA